jgi:hypothetical protein
MRSQVHIAGWMFQQLLLKRQRKMTANNWKELALNRSGMAWLRKPKPKEGCKVNWKEKTKNKKKGRRRKEVIPAGRCRRNAV